MTDITLDLAEARTKLDAARETIERHPEAQELAVRLERMAAEVARIEAGISSIRPAVPVTPGTGLR
jgi:hypothetical protein